MNLLLRHVHVLQTQMLSESLLTASCKTPALLFITSCKRRSLVSEHGLLNIDELKNLTAKRSTGRWKGSHLSVLTEQVGRKAITVYGREQGNNSRFEPNYELQN
jgi:hypothetical protein